MKAAGNGLRLIVHLSGSRPSAILPTMPGVMRLTLHPIQTFPKPNADLLRNIYWMASSMTVFAANFVTLIGGAIEEISGELGQAPKKIKAALRPLMEQSLSNALSKSAIEALTGPIARKDFNTIRKHQKALRSLDPKLKKIYDAFLEFGLEFSER